MKLAFVLLPFLAGIFPALAQGLSPVIVDSKTSRAVTPFPISPGMLLSLQVRGLQKEPRIAPDDEELPTEMDGIQVTFEDPFQGLPERPLPILRIDPSVGLRLQNDYRVITVYIPPDLLPESTAREGAPHLKVWVDGQAGAASEFRYTPTQLAVLNTCNIPLVPIDSSPFRCLWMMTGEDGIVLDGFQVLPKPGDTIRVWAIGLGGLKKALDVRTSVLGSGYVPLDGHSTSQQAQFRLHPVKKGVYLIDVKVPELPPEAARCGRGLPAPFQNLEVTVGLPFQWQGGVAGTYRICVDKP